MIHECRNETAYYEFIVFFADNELKANMLFNDYKQQCIDGEISEPAMTDNMETEVLPLWQDILDQSRKFDVKLLDPQQQELAAMYTKVAGLWVRALELSNQAFRTRDESLFNEAVEVFAEIDRIVGE